ncbi:hypothetical protein OK016_27835 [Vibrio chagasii]|nr:hypothetical protein [Vibrio chagasii]
MGLFRQTSFALKKALLVKPCCIAL